MRELQSRICCQNEPNYADDESDLEAVAGHEAMRIYEVASVARR
jgi:hypothetical protein